MRATKNSHPFIILQYWPAFSQVLSRDSVTVSVEAVVYYRVSNPTMAVSSDFKKHGDEKKDFFDNSLFYHTLPLCESPHPSPWRQKINNSFQATLSILLFSTNTYIFFSHTYIHFCHGWTSFNFPKFLWYNLFLIQIVRLDQWFPLIVFTISVENPPYHKAATDVFFFFQTNNIEDYRWAGFSQNPCKCCSWSFAATQLDC